MQKTFGTSETVKQSRYENRGYCFKDFGVALWNYYAKYSAHLSFISQWIILRMNTGNSPSWQHISNLVQIQEYLFWRQTAQVQMLSSSVLCCEDIGNLLQLSEPVSSSAEVGIIVHSTEAYCED